MVQQTSLPTETVSQYVARFRKDFSKRHMIAPKLINMFMISGLASLFQFLTVHMFSLGISMEEISFLNVVLPILSFATMPMVGVVSDKIGKPKLIVTIATIISAFSHLGLLYVPQRSKGAPKGVDQTLVTYFILRAIAGVALPAVMLTTDGVIMGMCAKLKEDFGFQKFYGVLGACFSPPIVGSLIDFTSKGKDTMDYSVGFYFFAFTQLACLAVMPSIQGDKSVKDKNKKDDDAKDADIKVLIKNPAVLGYLGSLLFVGSYLVIVETYLILFLKEMGATNSLLGLRAAVGGMSGLPFTFFGGFLLQRAGCANLLSSVLMLTGIRLVGHSTIQNPSNVLPFEVIEGFTLSISMMCASAYAAELAPPSQIMTLQGIGFGVFMGLGRSTGSLMGGVSVALLGYRTAFFVLGLLCLTIGVGYCAVFHKHIKKLPIKYKKDSISEKKKN